MSSQILSMDYDNAKPNYMDSVEFSYMDYLQYPQSPNFGVGINLPAAASPLAFNTLTLSGNVGGYTYSSMGASSPARPFTPPDGASISPHTLAYDLSGGEVASDPSSGRASRGSQRSSPAPSVSSPGPTTVSFPSSVPRSHRFNPMAASPASRPNLRHKRRASRSNEETDDEDEDFQPPVTGGNADSRRETIRKQRIESEQRRRDELRDGYARLRENLPASNQKASKVSILDRATGHIRYLETLRDQLELRLKSAEAEVHRLRNVNEALMLGAASRAQAATGLVGSF
ncbi:hypothetical protein FA15DRAFT_259318 [Coprinopsis marcescibilis]|uniref:BHLH domain-containing protein n=1 Tax=Coprinopsis marcescibilis TaxID=230819 RepID=A0A5C3L2P3_COPMA|nr:hypothetical protein FA15DRAFT_259318 [Coprinopsis marcescibilis]